MNFLYKLIIPACSPYVVELYNLATKNPESIFKKQIQGEYFRHIKYVSRLTNAPIVHKLEEHRYPGISYRHLVVANGQTKELKIYPLDRWAIRNIFFEYYDSFEEEL